VAAPSHVGNTLFDGDPARLPEMLEARPADVSFVIDWVLSGDYGPAIDADSIGVMGHSYGGYASLAVSGAEAHPARYNAFCADPKAENEACELTGSFEDPVDTVNYRDPRVQAAMVLSPGVYEVWEADGLAQVRIPVMILSGTTDRLTPHEREASRIHSGLTCCTRYLATFEGANHYGFTILCKLLPGLPPFCHENVLDPDVIQSAVSSLAVSFFGLTLKHDPGYGPWLAPEAVARFPGVSLERRP